MTSGPPGSRDGTNNVAATMTSGPPGSRDVANNAATRTNGPPGSRDGVEDASDIICRELEQEFGVAGCIRIHPQWQVIVNRMQRIYFLEEGLDLTR
jgi:hypothetical protein